MTKKPLSDIVYNIKRRYQDMMQRCYNPKCTNYKHYGKRGIKVSHEWKGDQDAFVEWALENGYSKELSLDRIDNDGDYKPDNCRWVDRRTQNINKESSVKTKTGYIGVTIHSSYKSHGYLYYYGRVRDLDGKIKYTGISKSLKEAVIMRNEYIIEHGLDNKLNEIPREWKDEK